MDADDTPVHLKLTGPETRVEILTPPTMKSLLIKMVGLSMVRPSNLEDHIPLSRARVVLKNLTLDRKAIHQYRQVCGFSPLENRRPGNPIPISYFQTLFIGLLGKFITTSHFPLNPMGLIQVGQSFEQKRAVTLDETLDLSCRLHGVTKTQKGIQTQFLLEAESEEQVVWQGISTFFTRNKVKHPPKKHSEKPQEIFLDIKEAIEVPRDTGRQYAGVSGDYNPHHLYGVTARLFGFKQPIAHGMWSLARAIASLERDCDLQYPLAGEGAFKLPIFMPALITLGYESMEIPKDLNGAKPLNHQLNFELRDEKKGIPHLKGLLYY